MNIVLLVDDFLPSTKSAPLMMQHLGLAFLRHGDSVTIMTPSGHLLARSKETNENGLTVIRFQSGVLKNIGMFRRAINEMLLPVNVLCYWFWNPKMWKTDLIVSYSPTIFWGLAIKIIKIFQKKKNYLILRDIFPQWAIDSGLLKKYSPITLFFRLFEKINYDAADIIGVQSPRCCEYFQNTRYIKKITVLFNWVEIKTPEITQPSECFGIRKKYHWENKVIFFYGGNIGLAQDMDNLMRLACAMKDYSRAAFLFVGNGDAFSLVQRRIEEWKLTNTLLLPPVSQDEYVKLLDECNIGMISLHPKHKTQNIPGKLLGYLTHSKPILASVNSNNDLLELIPKYNSGLISVNPDDKTLLKNAISLLDSSVMMQMKIGTYNMVKNLFDVNTTIQNIIHPILSSQK